MTADLRGAIEAVRAGDRQRLEDLLAGDPGLAAARDEHGVSLPIVALYHGQGELAEIVAGRRSALDLFEAAALGREAEVARLLAAEPGAVTSWSPDGFTPLHYAAYFGREKTARLLVERGAEVGAVARNPMRVTPLHSAVSARQRSIAEVLLESGADPDARQQEGYTPLMGAAANGDREMVELLLGRGADPLLEAADGRTARGLAAERGHPEVAELLAAAG